MTTPDTMHRHLATARKLLLEPFGLAERDLDNTLTMIASHRVDDADLFFQYTRAEGWSLEEGIVKTGSFSIDQGVGVRAVTGDRTAFAYSDDISPRSLADAARTVRAISTAASDARVGHSRRVPGHGRALYAPIDPIATLDSGAKVALLEKLEQGARAQDPPAIRPRSARHSPPTATRSLAPHRAIHRLRLAAGGHPRREPHCRHDSDATPDPTCPRDVRVLDRDRGEARRDREHAPGPKVRAPPSRRAPPGSRRSRITRVP
mgnify:CR=1 FL=1